jgi:hypothetical protein
MVKLLCGKGVYACLLLIGVLCLSAQTASAQLSGQELLRVTRVAQGGAEYASLQYITAKSQGFVNVAPFGAAGLGTGAAQAAVEMQFNLVDYQTKNARRRLEVTPGGPVIGKTFLLYDGSQGGGMYQGSVFRVSETAASRQWAMMGFDTLNLAADGQLNVSRQDDQTENGVKYYVVEAKFTSSDTIRYWIDQKTFLIHKVVTRFNNKPMVEETRADYRKVSCMMLPFRVVTKLQGQRLADLTVSQYDLQTAVPTALFTVTAQ